MPGTIIVPLSQPSESSPSAVTSPIKPTSCPFGKNSIQVSSSSDDVDPHCFIAPSTDCSRAPCPALNALANHGYLPRSGRQITFTDIMTALKEAFGLSSGFAFFMAVGSFTLLRRRFTHPFDLHETAQHNLIEHNASLVHDDANPKKNECDGVEYAPIKVDPILMRRFLSIACPLHPGSENVYTTSVIANYRVERELESKAPLDPLHAELGRAEFAMIIQIFGKQDEQGQWYVDQSLVDDFFTNQRLPVGWKPTRVLRLKDAAQCSSDIRHEMKEIRETRSESAEDERKQEEWHCKAIRWFIRVLETRCDP